MDSSHPSKILLSHTSPDSIYLYTHEFSPTRGGIAIYVQELAEALAQLEYQVRVEAPRHANTEYPFTVIQNDNHGTHSLADLFRTYRSFRKNSTELNEKIIILAEPAPILSYASVILRSKIQPKKLILIWHGSEIIRFYKNPLSRYLVNKLIPLADKIVVLSNNNAKLATQCFPSSKKIIEVIPGAPRALPAETISSGLPTPEPGKKVLLNVARFHPRKGQDLLITIADQLPVECKNQLELWFVGQIVKLEFFEKLKSQATQSGLHIRFFTEVDDHQLPHFYEQAYMFGMTSRPWKNSIEGFGLVYLEAAAAGLPVIGFETGGVSDAVKHQETGFLAPYSEQSSLTQNIEKLLQSPELYQKIRQNSIAFSKRYTWKDIAETIIR